MKGTRLSPDELRAIFQGLMANDLCDYDYILTGYMGSGSLLQVVAEYVRLIKQKSPHIKYGDTSLIKGMRKTDSCLFQFQYVIQLLVTTKNLYRRTKVLRKIANSF